MPLGMYDTGFSLAHDGSRPAAAGWQGRQVGQRLWEKPRASDGAYWNLRGNGCLFSTIRDLARWQQIFSTDLLPPAARQKLCQPHAVVNAEAGIAGAYGWFIWDGGAAGNRMIYHNGSGGHFSATMRWFPEHDRMVVVLSNQADQSAMGVAKSIADAWHGVHASRARHC
jgi:CubicO group peptidase (beta-lactamase class C family)